MLISNNCSNYFSRQHINIYMFDWFINDAKQYCPFISKGRSYRNGTTDYMIVEGVDEASCTRYTFKIKRDAQCKRISLASARCVAECKHGEALLIMKSLFNNNATTIRYTPPSVYVARGLIIPTPEEYKIVSILNGLYYNKLVSVNIYELHVDYALADKQGWYFKKDLLANNI